MSKILVVHGPNLNLLGDRETHHYGQDNLEAINARLVEQGRKAGHSVETFQSNAEAPLIERIHAAKSDEYRCAEKTVWPRTRHRCSLNAHL